MHPLFAKADRLSGEVIGAAIEVHRIMGTGLLELSYMKLLNVPLGFLFNFHEVKLVQGNSREGGPIGASDARSHLFLPDSGATEKTAQHQNWRIGLV